jgi:hypothetical protein
MLPLTMASKWVLQLIDRKPRATIDRARNQGLYATTHSDDGDGEAIRS